MKETPRARLSCAAVIVRCRYAFVALLMGAVFALQSAPARPVGASRAGALVLSDQARRYLALAYRLSPTELMGCMIGEVRGGAVRVERIAPADVDPAASTASHVRPRRTCEAAGWVGTVGMIHSHPGGERCFYYFPGTQVATSDAQSFGLQPYSVDAIMCGDSVVWINRDLIQRQLPLVERPLAQASEPSPGNRVHAGSRMSLRAVSAP